MNTNNEIIGYMGHKGIADKELEALVSMCLEKLETVSSPRKVIMQLSCTVTENCATIGVLNIESKQLAAYLCNCTQVFAFAATLGAAVDRLISKLIKTDSTEALCVQACAAAQIEDYCNGIEQELSHDINRHELYLLPRISPGYGDFDIKHQTSLLRILQAYKSIGVTETKAHMLTPLKSVTAVIGVSIKTPGVLDKCADCSKIDCQFRRVE
ncbi:MAG: hypothetical protein LBH42_07210 [Treponema sp.]|jgi:hypothetical protein|nr:hypothetical protein [Treponema sp.]